MFHLNDAVDLYVGLNSLLNEYWNFYSAVVLGIIAVVFGVERIRTDSKLKIVISFAFLVFALGNLFQIIEHQETLFGLVEKIGEQVDNGNAVSGFGPVLKTFNASPVREVVLFHLSLGFFVLVGIWSPEIFRKFQKK